METVKNACEILFEDYTFTWPIENFCSLEFHGHHLSEEFSPIPNFHFRLGVKFEEIHTHPKYKMWITLESESTLPSGLEVKGCVTLSDSDNMTWKIPESKFHLKPVGKTNDCLCIPSYKKIPKNIDKVFELPDDVLTLECVLVFWGHQRTLLEEARLGCLVALSNDIGKMFESGSRSDLEVRVGGKALRAHRDIVCARSTVFAKMFEHDMIESRTSVVPVEDFEYSHFERFLKFLYSGRLIGDEDEETVEALYRAGDKYDVASLRKMCHQLSASRELTPDNACAVLISAKNEGEDEGFSKAKKFILDNFFKVVTRPGWVDLVDSDPVLAEEITAEYQKTFRCF